MILSQPTFLELRAVRLHALGASCEFWKQQIHTDSTDSTDRLHDLLWITLKHCIAKRPKLWETYQDQLKAPSSEEHRAEPPHLRSPWWFHHPCRWARGFARPPFGWSWSAPGRYLRQNPTFHAKYPADHDCTGHSTWWYIYIYVYICMDVSMSVCMFVCLYVCMSVCYVCMSVCLSVCMYVCLYVCLSVCLSVCTSVCMSVCLCVCMSVCMYACMYVCTYVGMYVCLSVCRSVCMYVCLYVCMYVCMSVCPYVCLSVCLYVGLSVCMSVCMYVCLYVCLSVCLSVCMYVCMIWWYNIIFTCVYYMRIRLEAGGCLRGTFLHPAWRCRSTIFLEVLGASPGRYVFIVYSCIFWYRMI